MNIAHKIEIWGDRHHPKFIDIVRVALGVFLLWKGVAYMENTEALQDSIINQDSINISPGLVIVLMLYLTYSLMVGGALIAMGTLTRLSALVQIPNVLITLFMAGLFSSPFYAMQWPAIIALAFLVLFAIIGSGPLSLDHYLVENEEKEV